MSHPPTEGLDVKLPVARKSSDVPEVSAAVPEGEKQAIGTEHVDTAGVNEKQAIDTEHVDNGGDSDGHGSGSSDNLHRKAGVGVIRQQHTIPTTGKRMPTGKWEYIFFTVFYFSNNGAPIGGNGGALRQALISMQYPEDKIPWGGQTLPLNSLLLDITGIMFAVQLVMLLTIGPYADYGNWRPWIMIIGQVTLYITQFAMCGMKHPSQWQSAQTLYVLGSLAANIVTSFYTATFPGLVYNLPKMIESEHDVANGSKSYVLKTFFCDATPLIPPPGPKSTPSWTRTSAPSCTTCATLSALPLSS